MAPENSSTTEKLPNWSNVDDGNDNGLNKHRSLRGPRGIFAVILYLVTILLITMKYLDAKLVHTYCVSSVELYWEQGKSSCQWTFEAELQTTPFIFFSLARQKVSLAESLYVTFYNPSNFFFNVGLEIPNCQTYTIINRFKSEKAKCVTDPK